MSQIAEALLVGSDESAQIAAFVAHQVAGDVSSGPPFNQSFQPSSLLAAGRDPFATGARMRVAG
ncbi:hypothetical protein U5801_12205 [Lamprobacter modestohalophilus]|uniref:hypothetical protein n=1 Tax=Lamprobacter modestohalophilus TaxID=1064514 RepID=UPI002ADEAC18|nr:hypothetical protein [Lamprobacter modestohalophilus]MEA1050565.1 hypothetical protein [Lamprobacter modestohalophilus]